MLKTKIRNALSVQRLLAVLALAVLFILGLASPLGAQTLTQGYGTEGKVQKGMIIRLKEGDATKVQPVKSEEMDKMHGVVVDANDAAVTLSGDGQKVFVATTGKYEILVGTQQGVIKSGDFITVSALNGIGMKAGEKESMVIGRALEDFDGKGKVVGTTSVKDSMGGKKEVKLGRIRATIGVARNPNQKGTKPDLPEFLQKVSEAVAGKPVNATRVYMGLVVLAITTLVSGSLLYGGVRSGLISIGRNPLSKKLIVRGMIQVIITGLTIFILGVFGVYLLLRL